MWRKFYLTALQHLVCKTGSLEVCTHSIYTLCLEKNDPSWQRCQTLFYDGSVAIFSSEWHIRALKAPEQIVERDLGGGSLTHTQKLCANLNLKWCIFYHTHSQIRKSKFWSSLSVTNTTLNSLSLKNYKFEPVFSNSVVFRQGSALHKIIIDGLQMACGSTLWHPCRNTGTNIKVPMMMSKCTSTFMCQVQNKQII